MEISANLIVIIPFIQSAKVFILTIWINCSQLLYPKAYLFFLYYVLEQSLTFLQVLLLYFSISTIWTLILVPLSAASLKCSQRHRSIYVPKNDENLICANLMSHSKVEQYFQQIECSLNHNLLNSLNLKNGNLKRVLQVV